MMRKYSLYIVQIRHDVSSFVWILHDSPCGTIRHAPLG